MAGTSEKALRWLSTALEMERTGKAFYDKAIAECKNPVGREIFTTLMKDEIVHQDRIKVIYTQIEGGKPWSDDWASMGVGHGEIGKMFRGLAAKQGANIKADASDIQALDVGIDLESRSIEFYEGHLRTATDTKERAFLERMVEEEKSHHSVLTDLRFYLSDPSSWFSEHERAAYDGA
ncbi:MAG: ferritin family protein [bacterium]